MTGEGFTDVARNGCTAPIPEAGRCHSQDTPWLSSLHGRRCADHVAEIADQIEEINDACP